jgi:REP-associated tyrosine transposase
MPRKVRFNLIGIPQHIIQRGNNREACFYNQDDYEQYLHGLQIAADKFNCKIHAYVLMTNHVHILATPMNEHSVSEMMQSLGSRYVRYINKKYERTGTLWEGRFKSSLVDSDAYLLTCMRYIEMNPVRSKMVDHPGEYQWSSYSVNAQGKNSRLIEKHPLYRKLATTTEQQLKVYQEIFHDHLGDEIVSEIRDALNHELVIGRSYFKDKIDEITTRQTRMGQPGRPKVEESEGVYLVGY